MEIPRQSDCVLHRELGARADAKVRRSDRVAHKHNVLVIQPLVAHDREGPPDRAIADHRVAVAILFKQFLTIGLGVFLARIFHACVTPGLLARLDDPSRCAFLVPIDMRPPPAVVVLPEYELEFVNGLCRR